MAQDRLKLVFVHGLAGSGRWWKHVESRGRVTQTVEFRRADPLELDEPAAVVGHSLGGLLAAELAAAQPELVHALVLVAPVGAPRPLHAYAAGLARTLATSPLPLLRAVAADAVRWGPTALARAAWTGTRARFAGEVTAPTLLVWGERDPLVPVALAETWRQAIPHARIAVIPRAGHVPMLETPSAFNDALHDFLDGLGV